MKKLLSILALVGACFATVPAMASEGGYPLEPAPLDVSDMSSIQRGAKLFVNYCLNCHSASMMRYNRLRDIGLSDEQIQQNLLFSADKVGELMTIAMPPKDAKAFFGVQPPDLSVISRARGNDWLYTYLRTFYRDDSRATGWNNLVFPNVGMPHVLYELQGQRTAKFAEVEEHGEKVHKFAGFEQVTPGKLNTQAYDQAVADLVNYLNWMSEPAQNHRKRLGVWVLLFLGVLTVFAWRLNAAYWKDIK
ncbi:cytochrome c1 [Cupriavidus plantarum]|uniref:Ubiquinol-cytochrome c reductase cytochrome c1 subunit n=1 Tax=Cupriavidus plantarum TaxID=942865 RepID=A0A316EKS8_9BURK|nr:cytochrome c1 [Cupriavidus plantarum]NYI02954.1 ubiquinol-cytochrome c reductase cytochrome c1 subunit [Cupriavidus plantarum]PWK32319.1 ubiquinol-cytochrome c reductase cytochrome c1 subunit [Cupriavidus plantarum]REE87253.1 ubiquinol-cytochrome c reductase cytochrome c1 subunit [Cupriavidus plantarum]RLK29633.1 ubiquinol-cytochrome c reductase cytochrome c1 subunit [Cupriavidus plantarum]CAG2152522.1 Ammonia monooxygenase gamma subunit [Cupriavidus plantarum]